MKILKYSILLLCLLSPGVSFGSTVLDTPLKLLKFNSGTSTTTSTAQITLDSITIPSLSNKETIEVYYTLEANNTSVGASLRNLTNSTSIANIGGNSGTVIANEVYTGTCKITPQVKDTTTLTYWCSETREGSTTVINVVGEVATTTNATWDLALRESPGSSSSRTLYWKWEVFLHKSTGTTAITEEDGLAHLPDQTGLEDYFLSTNGTTPFWAVVAGGGGSTTMEYLTEEIFWNLINRISALLVFGFCFITLLFASWFFYHKSRY